MADYSGLFVYICLAAAIVAVIVAISGSLSPSRPSAAKSRPYECGVSEMESTQHRWPVRFALVAMLFLIFDVETIFLLPWAIIFMGDDFSFTKFALIEMFVFIGILIVGYYYAWRKGALE